MHSKIYEIRDEMLKPEHWASESEIADDEYGQIEGTDYYGEISDADERVELINDFFLRWFPNNSFEIVSNEPEQTACIRFVGNIRELYEQWIADIKRNADELNFENISMLGLFNVRKACEQPFGLYSKFYTPDWNGCRRFYGLSASPRQGQRGRAVCVLCRTSVRLSLVKWFAVPERTANRYV